MNGDALESSLGGSAQQQTPLQMLTNIEGPASSFRQDALDYFCHAQLASKVRAAPRSAVLHLPSLQLSCAALRCTVLYSAALSFTQPCPSAKTAQACGCFSREVVILQAFLQ